MQFCGLLPDSEQRLLRGAYDESLVLLADEWRQNVERKQTFWINLWQRSGDAGHVALCCIDVLDTFSRMLAVTVYGEDRVECDGYGWIINPVGSREQDWHVDYTLDYSTIFIPISRLTERNSLQYAVLPPNLAAEVRARATADLDHVDMDLLYREADWISVRQMLAKPYSILKLDFETIHRGVANTGDFDRVLFWISVKKGADLLPPEPLSAVITAKSQALS